ncbi:hypothetical protein SDC9_113140 [bioreactor metagenome]|uniref:Type II secretion system protein M n=1 Tax=bioreactor metagenome TaxID=1076179 RepID=A0A645BSM3_9ZZZZ
MSRAFTQREKVLLTVLALLLLATAYYRLVYQPVETELTAIAAGRVELESQLQVEQTRRTVLTRMRQSLAELEQAGASAPTPLAVYDNAQNVLFELADVLSAAAEYDLSFSPVTTEGNLARRVIGLTFVAPDYDSLHGIMERLYGGPYRCQIGDFTFSAAGQSRADLIGGPVRASLTVTYYELLEQ